jgi:hypothetical protein
MRKGLKKKLESIPEKHSIDSLQTKDSYIRNITHNNESNAV